MNRKRGRLIALAVLATLGIMFFMTLSISGGILRGLTTNAASLDPDSPDPSLRPIVVEANVPAAIKMTSDWADNQSAWKVVDGEAKSEIANESNQTHSIHLTRTSRLFRFVDDVHVQLTDRGDGRLQIDATSRSRVGKGDLGQNPRNLKYFAEGIRSASG